MNNNTEMKSVGEMCDEIKSLKEEIYGDTFWGINQGLRKEKSDLILQQKRMVKEIIKVKKDKAALITENDQLGEEIDALKSSVIHLRQLLPKQAWELSQAQGDCRHDRAELSYLRQSRDEIERQINNYRATANDIKCLVGVCKGETYSEAQKHIMKEQSIDYWREWRKRVTWGVID